MANIDLLVIESEKKKRRPSEGLSPSFGTVSVGGASPIAISKDNNGNFDFAALKLSNLASPTLASDAATKEYVDLTVQGLDPLIAGDGVDITGGGVISVKPADDSIEVSVAGVKAGFTKSFTNVQGSTITGGQVVYEPAADNVRLAKADQALNYGTTIGIVADASIANAASGKVFVRPGATIGGFSGLVVNQALYVSRTTAGSLTQSLAGFLPGEHVVSVGTALDANTIIFNPEYKVEF